MPAPVLMECQDLKCFFKNTVPLLAAESGRYLTFFQFVWCFLIPRSSDRKMCSFFFFYILRLFLCVSNNLAPQEWADCLLLYIHISIEKLETFISSFLVSPALELPETLSTKLKPLCSNNIYTTQTHQQVSNLGITQIQTLLCLFPGHGRFCLWM